MYPVPYLHLPLPPPELFHPEHHTFTSFTIDCFSVTSRADFWPQYLPGVCCYSFNICSAALQARLWSIDFCDYLFVTLCHLTNILNVDTACGQYRRILGARVKPTTPDPHSFIPSQPTFTSRPYFCDNCLASVTLTIATAPLWNSSHWQSI